MLRLFCNTACNVCISCNIQYNPSVSQHLSEVVEGCERSKEFCRKPPCSPLLKRAPGSPRSTTCSPSLRSGHQTSKTFLLAASATVSAAAWMSGNKAKKSGFPVLGGRSTSLSCSICFIHGTCSYEVYDSRFHKIAPTSLSRRFMPSPAAAGAQLPGCIMSIGALVRACNYRDVQRPKHSFRLHFCTYAAATGLRLQSCALF